MSLDRSSVIAAVPGCRAPRALARLVATIALTLPAALSTAVAAEGRRAPDTFAATTANMDPADVSLKIDVLTWLDEGARGVAIAALESSEDPRAALAELPTLGYVWLNGSAVGYAVKYAHREALENGGERVTIVTDKTLGTYSLSPWSVDEAAAAPPLEYSVIALDFDGSGQGTGTLSLAANVALDADAGRISLIPADSAPELLTAVKREPKPYWAREG